MATSKSKAAAEAAADGGLPAYRVLRNLEHDHIRYAIGDTVHLDDDDAGPLLEAGVVAPADAEQ